MSDIDRLAVGQQMLRGVGIFQAVIALPVFFFLGFQAFVSLLEPWSWLLYYFVTDTITAIMAAGIIFAVYVQRKASMSKYQYLIFEGTKSILATALWLWLILESAFGPWLKHCHRVFFYPSLAYAYLSWKKGIDADEDAAERGDATDRSPLLSSDRAAP
ncbi:hypothetical protein N0V90_004222 [Kalmusia sp. IMI 367209]|nr:hypothetical protein N0V90_004222 [Kalmusia sp. IMI 367209]